MTHMFTLLSPHHRHQQRDARPPQGRGHYSDDGRQWFDERTRRWLPRLEGQDTLVVALEDVDASGRTGRRAHPRPRSGRAGSRFVGRATSIDPRWRSYDVVSATFPHVPGVPGTELPPEAWVAGMTEALDELRDRLEAEGWCLVGRGMMPWAYRYVRPRVDWPSDDGAAPLDAARPPVWAAARG
jgi:hypothetical protein